MKTTTKETEVNEEWSLEIKPTSGWFELHLEDIWRYRDLLLMFVRRDFVAVYKQTILGPAWFFIQPILTTITFTIVFGNIAKISTDGLPQVLFYLSGIVGWSYFSDCITTTSDTFNANANIFGKVYFPRLIVPLSVIVSKLIKFFIQFGLFIGFLIFFMVQGAPVQPNSWILLTPFLIVIMGGLGLGFGIIISSLTTKYRDMKFLVTFGVQLFMYATPVIYPLSELDDTPYRWVIMANPMTPIIEAFRFGWLGAGSVDLPHLAYATVFMLLVVGIGMIIFNKVEKTFMDTV